jgi:hypothetical protein
VRISGPNRPAEKSETRRSVAERMRVKSDMDQSISPACGRRNTRVVESTRPTWGVIVQDRADAAALRNQRVAAVAEEVEVCLAALFRGLLKAEVDGPFETFSAGLSSMAESPAMVLAELSTL